MINPFKRPLVVAAVVAALAPASSLFGQTLAATSESILQKIDASNEELRSLHEEIADEKLPLVREVNASEEKLIDLRSELRRKERVLSTRESDLARLESRVNAYEEGNDYIAGLLDEFVRNFESRIHISEIQRYETLTSEAKLAQEDADMTETQKVLAQLKVVSQSIERLDGILGGDRFEGRALTNTGDLTDGTFATYGPAVYFASGDAVGLVQRQLNAAEPTVVQLDPRFDAGIRSLIESGEGSIAADATLGKAVQLMEVEESYFEHIQKGAVVGYAIIGLGLLAFALGIFKFIEISRFSAPPTEASRNLGAATLASDDAAAQKTIGSLSGPAQEMLKVGYEGRDLHRDILEERMYETITEVQPKLERFLPFLAITAAAAPLMGLLGTVIGMIKTFNLITVFGTGDAKSLSSGISEALVTTELGLTIAIPALVIHGLLSRLAKHKVAKMEQASLIYLNTIK
ncbi:MAG: MotA/TolQ/ExbB proton channel family protein [Synoicihabitans sp.]